MLSVPVIENDRVKLTLLDRANYQNLRGISTEKNLLRYSPSEISTENALKDYIEIAVKGYEHRNTIPFLVYDKATGAYAGSTRFGHIHWKNKTLHIGWTWIGKAFQGTGLNKHMKFLMLCYAFENLGFEKVEFRVDERNQRSRRAVEKLGATLEGILRQDTLMTDGYRRNTCCYGMLSEEWPSIKSSVFKDFQ